MATPTQNVLFQRGRCAAMQAAINPALDPSKTPNRGPDGSIFDDERNRTEAKRGPSLEPTATEPTPMRARTNQDPKQALLQQLTEIVGSSSPPKRNDTVQKSTSTKNDAFEALTIDSSISDAEKIFRLRQQNASSGETFDSRSADVKVKAEASSHPKPRGFNKPKNLLHRPIRINVDPSDIDSPETLACSNASTSTNSWRPISTTENNNQSFTKNEPIHCQVNDPLKAQPKRPSSPPNAAAESSPVANDAYCFFCGFRCHDTLEYFRHVRSEHVVHDVLCPECGERFPDEVAFERHYLGEHASCPLCGYMDATANGIKIHLKFHHDGESRKCEACHGQLNVIEKAIALEFGTMGAEDDKYLMCDHCGAITTYKKFWHKEHFKRVTKYQKPECNPHKRLHRKLLRLEHECTKCPFQTRNEDAFNQHVLHHDKTNWTLLQCDLCSFMTMESDKFRAHFKRHAGVGKIVKCQSCTFYTVGDKRLALHNLIHYGRRPLLCCVCGVVRVKHNQLMLHVKGHANDLALFRQDPRIVKCVTCGFRGTWKVVVEHASEHNGNNTQPACILCFDEFRTESEYEEHVNRHLDHSCQDCRAGAEIYECKCKQRFTNVHFFLSHKNQCEEEREYVSNWDALDAWQKAASGIYD